MRKNVHLLVALCIGMASICLSGCYVRTQEIIKDNRFQSPSFHNDEIITVMITDDGKYTFRYDTYDNFKGESKNENIQKLYLGSGITVAHKVQAALLSIFSHVELLNTKNREKAILLSKEQNARFLIIPSILHWEDRNTPWSGIADKIEIKIEIMDIATEKVVNSIIFRAHNEWATLTDQPPEDLLNGKFNEAIISLFNN